MPGDYYDSTANPGAYVPTTNVWDVTQLYSVDVNSPEFKELLVRLYQNINNISLLLNIKDTGYYPLEEFLTSQGYFPSAAMIANDYTSANTRGVFRKVINFGALPNTATKSVAHGISITTTFTFTRIYATASDTTGLTYIPIPYASPTDASNIELSVDVTNVNITTGSNRTNYNVTYVVLEYLKQ